MIFRAILIFLAFLIGLLPMMGGIASASAGTKAIGAAGVDPEALRAAARTVGQVRVFVEIDMPVSFHDPERIERGARDLAAVQAAVITRAIGGIRRSHRYRAFTYVPFVAVTVTASELDGVLADPAVRWVGPVEAREPVGYRYNIEDIRVEDVWKAGYTGDGYTVAVIDTGIDLTHPMLRGRIVDEFCYTTQDPAHNIRSTCPNKAEKQIGPGAAAYCKVGEDCDHGSHVAGIAIGAAWGELIGVAKGGRLIAGNVFSRVGSSKIRGFDDDIVSALERVYSLRNKHRIAAVNLSLGKAKYFQPCGDKLPQFRAIIRLLKEAKIATVIASGNQGYDNALNAPACVEGAVAVGAMDPYGNVWEYSNHSQLVRMLAPGVEIRSAVPGNKIGIYDGTSQAAPHVAGAFAVLRDFVPAASVDQIVRALQCTGPIGERAGIRKRRIDLWEAYQVLRTPENKSTTFEFRNAAEGDTWSRLVQNDTQPFAAWRVTGGGFRAELGGDRFAGLAWIANCNVDLDLTTTVQVHIGESGGGGSGLLLKSRIENDGDNVSGYHVRLAESFDTDGNLRLLVCRVDNLPIGICMHIIDECDLRDLSAKAGAFHELAVKIRGETFSVSIDGTPRCSFKDGTYTTGAIALYADGSLPTTYDRVVVVPRDGAAGGPLASRTVTGAP